MVPSFFKILLDPSAPHLPLPPAFTSMLLASKIPNSPTIHSANGGYSWRLNIQQIGDCYCFVNGWKNVVSDAELGFGDFLVFKLIDRSMFKMFVYSPNGCEKILTQKTESVDEYEIDGGEKEDVDDEDEIVEEHDDDDEEHDDDDDDEEHHDDDDDDDDDEDDDDKNDGDPFFVSIMTRANKKILRFPVSFMNSAKIRAEGTMILKNLEGKEWLMGVKLDKSFRQSERYLLSSGWCGFRRKNALSEGDKCVFKFIRSERKLFLAKVTKKIP